MHWLCFQIFCFFLVTYSLSSQEIDPSIFVFKNTENGMSNSWVSDIQEGPYGYMWIATQNGINRYDGKEFVWYNKDLDKENSLLCNWIRKLMFTPDSLAVYAGHGVGLGVYDLKTETYYRPPGFIDTDSIPVDFTYNAIIDSLNQVWLSTENELIIIPTNRSADAYHKKLESQDNLTLVAHEQSVFAFSNHGIFEYNIENYTLINQYTFDEEVVNVAFHQGIFWIVTSASIIKWNKEILNRIRHDGSVLETFVQEGNLYGYGPRNIYKIDSTFLVTIASYRDFSYSPKFEKIHVSNDGKLWIGTSKGLFIENLWKKKLVNQNSPIPIKHTARAIQIHEGKVYLGKDEGLYIMHQNGTKEIWLDGQNVQSLLIDQQSIWVGTQNHDVYSLSFSGSILAHYNIASTNKKSIYSIVKSKTGDVFICTWSAVWKIDPTNNTLHKLAIASNLYNPPLGVIHSTIDRDNHLWLSTNGNGVFDLTIPSSNESNPEIIKYHTLSKTSNISSDVVPCILEDSKGNIWIGTDAGINKINPAGAVEKRYGRKEGLIDEKIMAIEEDNQGRIWFSTIGHGMYLYYPEDESFVNLTAEDGLKSNNFFFKSSTHDANGILYFGCDEGIQIIDPKAMQIRATPQKILFTSITTYSAKNKKLKTKLDGIDLTSPLKLHYNENDIHLSFASLDFQLGNKIHYQYAWKDQADRWIDLGSNREIYLSGLSPGNYGILIKALMPGYHEFSVSAPFQFTIRRPWWQTLTAYFLYLMAFVGMFYWINRLQLKRNLAITEAKNAVEMSNLKNQLFAFIAHEFKTPLTLIRGSTQYLLNRLSRISTPELKEKLEMTEHQTIHLNKLIHQALNLKDQDLAVLDYAPQPVELIRLTKFIVASFSSWTESKEIELTMRNQEDMLWVELDREKYFHIISNLISNSIKYTPSGGNIQVNLEKEQELIQIEITDTGIGFNSDESSDLFKPYVKGDKLSNLDSMDSHGLGLSIVQSLVQIMRGTIEVESQPNKGSTFRILLPYIASVNHTQPKVRIFEKGIGKSENRPLVLVVEDNHEISKYIQEILSDQFIVECAQDGKDGLEQAQKFIPDLIISDVKMPLMNGLEMMDALKSDEITAHIPVIILSAWAEVEDRIKAYKYGADQYVGKPFHEKELIQLVKTLLNQRKELAKHFLSNKSIIELPGDQKMDIAVLDKQFLEKLNIHIIENISSPELTVSNICRYMHLSRSQLHRKLTALTTYSVTKYVNRIKIQQAQIMLMDFSKSISQISYDVGYTDPAYFTKLFKKDTGKSPSEYRIGLSKTVV